MIFDGKVNGKSVFFDSLGNKVVERWYNNDSLILEYNLKEDRFKFPVFSHLDLRFVDKPELIISYPKNSEDIYLSIRTRLYPRFFYRINFNNSIISDKRPPENIIDKNTEFLLIINSKFKGKKVIDCDIEVVDYYGKVINKWHYNVPF